MNLKSYLIAFAMALLLGLWMLSGQFGVDDSPAQSAGAEDERAAMAVRVTRVDAEPVQRFLENQGDTRADEDVRVRAETAGRVVAVEVEEGDRVAAGDPLVRLAMNDRAARRAEAEARVLQAKADFEAAQRLRGDGFQSEVAVNEARAALESARARLAAIEEEIADTRIEAPVAGVVEERPVAVGDYVAVGDDVARLIDADPLIAVANVAQQDIRKVRPGSRAQIELATGDKLEGKVTYISSAAESGSRTFRVEVTAPNPKGLPVGVSATVRIPLAPIEAHFVSPAWLSLEDTGQVGVKAVDEQDRVVFYPVDIVRAERDGVWVSGLPGSLRIITVGQGFVRPGEPVRPMLRDAPLPDVAPGAPAAASAGER